MYNIIYISYTEVLELEKVLKHSYLLQCHKLSLLVHDITASSTSTALSISEQNSKHSNIERYPSIASNKIRYCFKNFILSLAISNYIL